MCFMSLYIYSQRWGKIIDSCSQTLLLLSIIVPVENDSVKGKEMTQ